jgi:hypothetical protein
MTYAAGPLSRASWPEQIGQRFASGDSQYPFVKLLVREIPARPPLEQRLSNARVKPLSTNRSKRVCRRLPTSHPHHSAAPLSDLVTRIGMSEQHR